MKNLILSLLASLLVMSATAQSDAYDANDHSILHFNTPHGEYPNLSQKAMASRSFQYLVEKERYNSRAMIGVLITAAGLVLADSGNSYSQRRIGGQLAVVAGTAVSIDGVVTFFKGRRILKRGTGIYTQY